MKTDESLPSISYGRRREILETELREFDLTLANSMCQLDV
jgi:hypothetical protein